MFLAICSEFGLGNRKAKPAVRSLRVQPEAKHNAVPVAIPVAEVVANLPLPAGVRRLGSLSHLRALTPQEVMLFLMGQLSALMDSKDTPDWTINPAYHPDVNAFIKLHASNTAFVAKARALQRNRAPFYGKTVVAGVRRKTILSMGRATVVDPPRHFGH